MITNAPLSLRVPLTPPQAVGETDAQLWPAVDETAPAVVLAHGAGTNLHGVAGKAIAEGIAAAGHPVMTFNFAYAQAGRRSPDPQARLLSAWRDAIAAMRNRTGAGRPLVIGGRSMGGRMASLLAAEGFAPLAGLVLLNYPLHAIGRPEKLRTAHWPDLRVPVLFVHGDRDAMCPLDVFERERAARLINAPTTVHVVAGADHSFGVRARDGRTRAAVLAEAVKAATDWLRAI
jgi:predicted alpha/beta-hydrolase family hydrolase